MDWNKTNKWTALVASLVSLASVVNADSNDMQMRNLDNRVTALEQKRGATGIINPSVNPQVKDGLDLSLSGEFLYWKSSVEDNYLGFQSGIATIGTGFTGQYAKGRALKASSDWAPGYRVAIGYVLPHDGWNMDLSYTSIRNNGDGSDTTSTGIIPPMPSGYALAGGGETLPTSMTMTGKTVLNMIDLTMGREFYTSKFLSMRPFIGVRNTWFSADANASYTGATGGTDLFASNSTYKVQGKLSQWHIGMRAGLDTNWTMGAGFSIYANTSASLLYGNNFASLSFARVNSAYITSETQSIKSTRLVLDLGMGFAYNVLLADDTMSLTIRTGWNQLADRDLSVQASSFSYQGWNFGVKLGF